MLIHFTFYSTWIIGENYYVQFTVNDEDQLNTNLGNISNFLYDNATVVSQTSSYFAANSKGLVILTKRLDIESLCSEVNECCERNRPCQLKSKIIIDNKNLNEFDLINLNVTVLDRNDHQPKFLDSEQIIKVPELSSIGSMFTLKPATDNDMSTENQIQRYTIDGIELKQCFELDTSEFPFIQLRLTHLLDYENRKSYHGVLKACDPKSCDQQNLTVLVIDANDNKPKFTKKKYEILVPENFTVGNTVLQLEASDRDSEPNAQMLFSIQDTTDLYLKRTFRLEPNTGALILQSRLAAHQRLKYRFNVHLSEALPTHLSNSQNKGISTASASDTALVIINVQDLNDFSPVISLISPKESQSLSVPENLDRTRVCVFQVTDQDQGRNAIVECQLASVIINSITNEDAFELKSNENIYTLYTTKPFDAEQKNQVTVTVTCKDQGNPPRSTSRDLVIEIEDLNEYPPDLIQDNYETSIKENTKAGIEIIQVGLYF